MAKKDKKEDKGVSLPAGYRRGLAKATKKARAAKKKAAPREDFSQAAARIVREATED